MSERKLTTKEAMTKARVEMLATISEWNLSESRKTNGLVNGINNALTALVAEVTQPQGGDKFFDYIQEANHLLNSVNYTQYGNPLEPDYQSITMLAIHLHNCARLNSRPTREQAEKGSKAVHRKYLCYNSSGDIAGWRAIRDTFLAALQGGDSCG